MSLCSSFTCSHHLLHLQGFNQEDLEDKKESKKETQEQMEESDSDDGVDRSGQE